jgi:hypothetical protein
MDNEKSEVVKFREGMGIEILFAMEESGDLPLPNKRRLTKVMQEYFKTLGKDEEVKFAGYKWKPTPEYWDLKLRDICDTLRKDYKQFFFFLRTPGGKNFEGVWKFGSKKEYEIMLKMEHGEIDTRIDTHNEKLTDGQQRWQLNFPLIQNVPQLN